MNTQVKPIPEDMHSLTPHLVCKGALEAMAFYQRAFDAVDGGTLLDNDGKLMHGRLRIGDSTLMLMEENRAWGALGPATLQGSPVTLHLYVRDVDAVFAQAVAAGATSRMAPMEMFWGDRYGVLTDPFGHSWAVATHTRDMTPEEIQTAASQMGSCPDAVTPQ